MRTFRLGGDLLDDRLVNCVVDPNRSVDILTNRIYTICDIDIAVERLISSAHPREAWPSISHRGSRSRLAISASDRRRFICVIQPETGIDMHLKKKWSRTVWSCAFCILSLLSLGSSLHSHRCDFLLDHLIDGRTRFLNRIYVAGASESNVYACKERGMLVGGLCIYLLY